jgi:hypothetical protein
MVGMKTTRHAMVDRVVTCRPQIIRSRRANGQNRPER